MYVCPSVHPSGPMEQLGSLLTDFYEIWYLNIFRKNVRENLNFIKIWQEYGYFTRRLTYIFDYIGQFFLEWEMFQIKVTEKIKTHILCSAKFFENRTVYETV